MAMKGEIPLDGQVTNYDVFHVVHGVTVRAFHSGVYYLTVDSSF